MKRNALMIELVNPVHCPLRIIFESNDEWLDNDFKRLGTIELRAKSDTLITINSTSKLDSDTNFDYRWNFGSLSKEIKPIKLALPFPKERTYRVVQGNNTNFTHNTAYSRFAVDIDLKINDTICAATKGVVVGVVDEYTYGGTSPEWKKYANFITIYEPNSGIFTQYVHLVKDGSLVSIGDSINQGQPIGLSGMTGLTFSEHLHFNCLVPATNPEGLKSIPFEFLNGYASKDLKKGDLLKH
jgi:murein DD-endopeptidase MepM/ murein hydrolase activator NlpD